VNLTTPPYTRLSSRRLDVPQWLPPDLRAFYEAHEGVGREASADYPVRISKLAEVALVAMHDLHLFNDFPLLGGWDRFAGIRIGIGCFFEELIYVTQAPVCPPGSIMAFGVDVDGPGGVGSDDDAAGSLVLAATFGEWINRLRVDGWVEIGLVPGEIDGLSTGRATELRRRFAELNPRSGWGRR
jgi:hypothetical protein